MQFYERFTAALVAGVLCWGTESAAVAQPTTAPPMPPTRVAGCVDCPEQPPWYGWQIVAADLGLIAATITLAEDHEHLAYASFAGLFLVPAVIHVVHDNNTKALWSVVLRAGLPTALGVLAYSPNDDPYDGPDNVFHALKAAMIGGAIAMGVDWWWAREPRPARRASVAVTPCRGPGCMTLGLAGTW